MGFNVVTPAGVSVSDYNLRWSFSRSGGAGGQHVNTSDTTVTLQCSVEDISGPPHLLERIRVNLNSDMVIVTVSKRRSQWQNRLTAADLMRERLTSLSQRQVPRRETRVPHAAKRRRATEKKMTAERKRERKVSGDD